MASSAPAAPTTADPAAPINPSASAIIVNPVTPAATDAIMTTSAAQQLYTPPTSPAEAFNTLTVAIYQIQHQLGDLSLRMAALEHRSPPVSSPVQYGLPGYGGIPSLPASAPIPLEVPPVSSTASAPPAQPAHLPATGSLHPQPSVGVPITQISFPPSPSPVPSMSTILHGGCYTPQNTALSAATMHCALPHLHVPQGPHGHTVPRYHKLSFPTFDGKVDPLGWLNKCEQFFRAQQTPDADRVWLASYHLSGTAQQWYITLERDAGEPAWDEFKRLCH